MSTHEFQTEVNQLLHLIIHSLYSHKEIFLRELVSNASDALDKYKFLSLTDERFKQLTWQPRIDLRFTEPQGGFKEDATDGGGALIEVSDNGIGMSEAELIEHLGTIAKSGTKAFLKQLSGDEKRDSNLIGQFGVGFYSAFMIADRIDVVSRKAGETTAARWSSDGKTGFETAAAERAGQGTTVTLHLNAEGREFASRWKLQDLVKKYSNHIAFPIWLGYEKVEYDDKGKETGRGPTEEQVNSASALWKRPKSEVSDDEYKEFFKTLSHEFDDPLCWLHTRAEGTLEYTTLFFVPKKAPFDLYHADYRPGVKLFVKRVFITDDEKELLPTWLRFVRGVIDSEDLPLNVSREILQQNRVMHNIRSASVKKLLGEFGRIAQEESETWNTFIGEFNRPLKEGLYSDFGNREALLDLVRFKSTVAEGWTSLAGYVDRMLPDQKAIYFLTGDNEAALRASPLLEAYRKKKIEVLIMADEIDEIVMPGVGSYKEKELKPVNRADVGEDLKDEGDKEQAKEAGPVAERIKLALGDRVKDVRVSVRLSDSPSCIVTDDSDPTFQMQAMLKSMGRGGDVPEVKPILEINPGHAIVLGLKDVVDEELVADAATLLLDQALLLEGVDLKDVPDFVRRLNRVLGRVL